MSVLVIAAHPDDEVLGVGGTLAVLAAQGIPTAVVILAEGVSLRHQGMTLVRARATCEAAAEVLGVSALQFGGFSTDGLLMSDGRMRPVIDVIAAAIARHEPEVVFTHHPGDIHADHRLVAEATTYATRVLAGGSVRRVLHYEVMSSTDQQHQLVAPFAPNVFYDMKAGLQAKCDALEKYTYEVFDDSHPRSVHGVRMLAGYRGVQVGLAAAEAFVLSRELVQS